MAEKEFEIVGLKVTRHVEKEEINKFVAQLAPEPKSDFKNVLMVLHEKDLTIKEKD